MTFNVTTKLFIGFEEITQFGAPPARNITATRASDFLVRDRATKKQILLIERIVFGASLTDYDNGASDTNIKLQTYLHQHPSQNQK
jgi:hypothetical protein